MSVIIEVLDTLKDDVTSIIDDINWNPSGLDADDCIQMIEIKSMFIRINQRIDAITLRKQV